MKTRLLTILCVTVAFSALAQQPTNTTVKYVSNKTTATQVSTPPPPVINFVNQKVQIDSLVSSADAGQYLSHASFRGKAREGKYWVECFYSAANKEILKANYLFTTDSLNFSRCYYFKNNNVVKVFDNNTTNYYQVGNILLIEQGTIAPAPLSKKFTELIVDTFEGLKAGLFPN